MPRPELTAPPEVFYNSREATKYMRNTRIQRIQVAMAKRAVELLNLPSDCPPLLLLDIGCGTGLSGTVLEENGHHWVGMDISQDMLDVAMDRGTEGELIAHDMGTGLPFRPGVFDGAISISALQWLCNADRKDHIPQRRLKKFFTTLFASLVRGGRAVFQFYPANRHQLDMIVRQSEKCGFTGGLVVDYPHSTRAKKYFLVLFAGPSSAFQPPEAKTLANSAGHDIYEEESEESDEEEEEEENEEEMEEPEQAEDQAEGSEVEGDEGMETDSADDDVKDLLAQSKSKDRKTGKPTAMNIGRRKARLSEKQKRGRAKEKRKGQPLKRKEWIAWKKEQAKAQGKQVRPTSKYSGRRRNRKGGF